MALICPFCGQENADHARFCRRCGKPLTRACPQCGQSVSLGANYCSHCSHPLSATNASTPSVIVPGATGRLTPTTVLDGRYVIVRMLGKGGMGAVYLADDRRISGQQWAIKEMSDQSISDPVERQAAIDAFNREAELLARLEHPNLPKVSNRFSEYGNQFLVMEYVPGQTLEKRLEAAHGPLPEAEVRNYVNQLCDVLDYLHGQQPPIIFRDLKPANIIVRPDGRLKLIDFGIARHFKPGKAKDTQAMGTSGYAAPEQYGKGQSDARTDIYALGATMHHMLTGRDPSTEPFKFPPVRTLNNRAPPTMETVIMRAVAMDVSQRWQSVRDLKAAMVQQPAVSAPATFAASTVVASLPAPSPAPKIPPAFVATPTPPQAKSSSTQSSDGFKRAGWFWFFFITIGIGVFLASPLFLELTYSVYRLVENGGVIWGMILGALFVAYQLTHRPAAILLAAVTAVWASMSYFDSLWPNIELLLLWAILIEGALMLSGWRAHNLLALWLVGMVSSVASIFLVRIGSFDLLGLVYLGFTLFAALMVGSMFSAIVNLIVGVGRQP